MAPTIGHANVVPMLVRPHIVGGRHRGLGLSATVIALLSCAGRVEMQGDTVDASPTEHPDAMLARGSGDDTSGQPAADPSTDSTSGAPLDGAPTDGPIATDDGHAADQASPEGDDASGNDDATDVDVVGADAPSVTCEGGSAVPVCVEYYAFLVQCFNRPDLLGLACQPSLLATSDADVSGIVALCTDNLMRIQQACR